jgi:hypothetical protein
MTEVAMPANTNSDGKKRIQFSLRTLLAWTAILSIACAVTAYVADNVRNANVYAQLRAARKWQRELPSNGKSYSFNLWIEGKQFAITNTRCFYDKETDTWAVTPDSEILSGKLFAIPPGTEVASADEAFYLFQLHVAHEKARQSTSSAAK